MNYMNHSDRTWRNMSLGSFNSPAVPLMGRTESLSVDPVRRLLIVSCELNANLRAFDLTTLVGEPTPTAGSGAWKNLNVVANSGALGQYYNVPWRYCPDDGNFYRLPAYSNQFAKPANAAAYNAMPLANRQISKIHRLIPPTVGTNYFTGTWTYDELTLGTPVPRPSYQTQYSSVNNKWFVWVPALHCFAWCPLDQWNSNDSTATRNCVYLIKPPL